ncbi:MAG: J domain-containing protein [Spirochaetaceae bacterium]|jgi:DnaJ-domain-containing protein 1|nr:J domain-containing protein [Spirochaetaceae bacterium]
MGIVERLGRILENRINDGLRRNHKNTPNADPDLEDAYSELNDYLSGKEKPQDSFGRAGRERKAARQPPVPEELKADFAELGVPFGADRKTCKEAYKKLLKLHHPDRHAAHEGNMKKATEKTARVNAAYERVESRRGEWDPNSR